LVVLVQRYTQYCKQASSTGFTKEDGGLQRCEKETRDTPDPSDTGTLTGGGQGGGGGEGGSAGGSGNRELAGDLQEAQEFAMALWASAHSSASGGGAGSSSHANGGGSGGDGGNEGGIDAMPPGVDVEGIVLEDDL